VKTASRVQDSDVIPSFHGKSRRITVGEEVRSGIKTASFGQGSYKAPHAEAVFAAAGD
jgi:hypothetical protein